MVTPVGSEGIRGAHQDDGAARIGVRQGQMVPRPERSPTPARTSTTSRRSWRRRANEKELRAAWEGWHTISPPMKRGLRAVRRAVEQGRARSSGSRTPARCGARSTTCRPTSSRRSSIGCGIRCGRCISSCTRTSRMKLREKYGDIVPANGPIPAYLLGNIWAQDWSNIYPLVAPPRRRPGLLADRHPEEAQDAAARHGARRRALLHVARLRAAAEDLLGTLPLHAAARSRRRVPRERVGHRPRGRRPHQDVHRADGRGLHDDPSRARSQLLSARLQGSSRCCSATAPTTASTKRSATPSRCR